MKNADGDADEIATDQVRRQRPERQHDEQRIQREAKQPARPGAERSAESDHNESRFPFMPAFYPAAPARMASTPGCRMRRSPEIANTCSFTPSSSPTGSARAAPPRPVRGIISAGNSPIPTAEGIHPARCPRIRPRSAGAAYGFEPLFQLAAQLLVRVGSIRGAGQAGRKALCMLPRQHRHTIETHRIFAERMTEHPQAAGTGHRPVRQHHVEPVQRQIRHQLVDLPS